MSEEKQNNILYQFHSKSKGEYERFPKIKMSILYQYYVNNDDECNLVLIEPYSNDVLNIGFPYFSKLIPEMIQNIPLLRFSELKENDILFTDSSHVNNIYHKHFLLLIRLL